jgi:hypothetical protein
MHGLGGSSGIALGMHRSVLCKIFALPARRYLEESNLSGTLPTEWADMTAMTSL